MASHISETTSLLPNNETQQDQQFRSARINHTEIDAESGSKLLSADVKTTRSAEAKLLASSSGPLMLTYVLQYSFTMTTVIAAGHLGTSELGAVSLATMTANVSGLAVYEGLASSLDTLCSQAYGANNPKMVGLHMQRMVFFLWLVTVPIGTVWICSPWILGAIVPEKDLAVLAGSYLRILLIGAPGYATFEAGKRFVQAQGLFTPSLFVLLMCAPLNVLLNWIFVWVSKGCFPRHHRGYILTAITETRMGPPGGCCGGINDKYIAANLAPSLRSLRYSLLLEMLAWLLTQSIHELGTYDQACRARHPNGRSRVAGIRHSHLFVGVPGQNLPGRPVRTFQYLRPDVSSSLPS
jgi:MatE